MKTVVGFLGGAMVALTPFASLARKAWAMTGKIILPRGTDRKTLINQNPASLDTRNLETTPLEDFGTMGQSDHGVELPGWRLSVSGSVGKTLSLSYEEILALPSMEREVLLICPGFFANHGLWKGISIDLLVQMAQGEPGNTHVTVRGPSGPYEKVERIAVEDIRSGRVFLAYGVNGKSLPQKHGFPLRLVAEGQYGYDWIKYVDSLIVERIPGAPKS
jgi:sulfoxide reductase catalytic subunit YedY